MEGGDVRHCAFSMKYAHYMFHNVVVPTGIKGHDHSPALLADAHARAGQHASARPPGHYDLLIWQTADHEDQPGHAG